MKSIRSAVALALSVLLCFGLSACGKEQNVGSAKPYDEITASDYATDGEAVAENESFALLWDGDNACIKLAEKKTGKLWSSTPLNRDGEYLQDESSLYSPISIEFLRRSAYRTIELTGKSGAVENGRVFAEKIENGIKLTFMFDEISVAVPVSFVLSEDGLTASVNTAEIVENPNNDDRIFKISLLPYFCSAENSSENYLIVPSGSGALMYTDERSGGLAREFEAEIYGEDPVQEINEQTETETPVRLEVFGAVDNGSALSAIVTDSPEKCGIKAVAGDEQHGFSYIYPTFQVRGYNGTVLDYGGSTGKKLVNYYTEDMIADCVLSVKYSPCTDERDGYMSVAENYRNYLANKYSLEKQTSGSVLSLKLYGAMQIKKHFLGFPYSSDRALTEFGDVEAILKELSVTPDIQLVGFGKGGIDNVTLGGGFAFSGSVGSKKDLTSLLEYCEKNSVAAYFDYELVYFKKSGNGFSASKDNCHTANGYPAESYKYSASTNAKDTDLGAWSILSRLSLGKATEKLLKAADKYDLSGISLSSLSNTAFSDFADKSYENRALIAEQVTELMAEISDSERSVAVSDANSYAAALAAKIFDAPVSSGDYAALDADIPLYEIVFKGYVPLSSASVNTAVDGKARLLSCIETGISVQYSLINDYSSDLAFYGHDNLQLMLYKNNKEKINEMLEYCGDYLSAVSGLSVTDYTLIDSDLRKTVFEDGTVVYVNYGSSERVADGITVPASDYKVVQ